jgi:predicted membrane-bound dolichyl-phosphate-mannose-protein mannosyltransferase
MTRPFPLTTEPATNPDLSAAVLTVYIVLVIAFVAAIVYVGYRSWKETRDE